MKKINVWGGRGVGVGVGIGKRQEEGYSHKQSGRLGVIQWVFKAGHI